MSEVVNHMVIGLGGTGGKIIREMRKSIAADQRPTPNVIFEWLYMDSSAEMMAPDNVEWRILGKSVQLSRAQQLLIEGAGLDRILADIDAYPNIRPWIEPLDVIQGLARENVDSAQGGQRRKFGRFLFANAAKEFVARLNDRVQILQKAQSQSRVTFHVCAGLAGGTGSGAIVDVIAQIRRNYPDANRYRILVYALLPDRQPNPDWNRTGYYHANGYAALQELNALDVGAYYPTDLAGSGARLVHREIAFNGCYLFTNENEAGVFVDVDKQLPKIVADFLHQKTLGLSWATLHRFENAENAIKDAERSLDGARAERGKRFLSFGIRRLVVPEEEIREYLGYNIGLSCARQALFGNWVDGHGYSDQPRALSVHEEVAKPELAERWRLSDEHIVLSAGILPQDANNPRWRPIPQFWQAVVPQQKEDIKKGGSKKSSWLDELKTRCDQVFVEGYRGMGGVRKFYEIKARDRADQAKFIRQLIEREFFSDWENGQRSLHDIERVLAALISRMEERHGGVETRLAKLKEQEQATTARISESAREWAGLNFIADLLGKGDKLFNASAEYLTQQYIYRTYLQGWEYGKRLLEEILKELQGLRAEISRCASTLQSCSDAFGLMAASRLGEQVGDAGSHQHQIYNREAVLDLNKRIVLDEELQKRQSQSARRQLIDRLGEEQRSFASFNARTDLATASAVLELSAAELAEEAHVLLSTTVNRVLDVNIVSRLYEAFGHNDDEMNAFVRNSISRAGTYLTFDPQEEAKKPLGAATPEMHFRTTGIFIPACQEHEAFAKRLRGAFAGNKLTAALDLVEEGARTNEITIMRVDNLFPLRFVSQIRFLKEKYEQLVSDPVQGRILKVLLHGEGDGSELPPLFIPAVQESKDAKLPQILIACALGVLQERKSPSTGRSEAVIRSTDSDGIESEVIVGKSRLEVVEKMTLDFESLNLIQNQVDIELKRKENLHEERRLQIYQLALALVNEIKAEKGGDLQDPNYQKIAKAAKGAKELLGLG